MWNQFKIIQTYPPTYFYNTLQSSKMILFPSLPLSFINNELLISSFDERIDCNSSYGGGIKSILTSFQILLDHFGETKLTGHHTQVFNSSMAGKCIAIRAHVVDTHGCEGPEFNQTISIPRPKIDQHLAIDLNQRTPVSYSLCN